MDPASKGHGILNLTCSTCLSSKLQCIKISSEYAEVRSSSTSLMALSIYPWYLAMVFIIPRCITVGLNRLYLVWKAKLCSSPVITHSKLNAPWTSGVICILASWRWFKVSHIQTRWYWLLSVAPFLLRWSIQNRSLQSSFVANSTGALNGDDSWRIMPVDIFSSSHLLRTTNLAHDIEYNCPLVSSLPSFKNNSWSMPTWCGGSWSARTLLNSSKTHNTV